MALERKEGCVGNFVRGRGRDLSCLFKICSIAFFTCFSRTFCGIKTSFAVLDSDTRKFFDGFCTLGGFARVDDGIVSANGCTLGSCASLEAGKFVFCDLFRS